MNNFIRLIVLIIFLVISFASANEFSSSQLGNWPLLSNYSESECLIIDDERIAITPSALMDGQTIYSQMVFSNSGGKVFVNPEITKGRDSLTFSIETANRRGSVAGYYCYLRIDIEVKAESNKYKKLYVVVDKTVLYELNVVTKSNLNR